MREPLSNMGLVCSGCARKADPKFRKVPVKQFIGKYCKLAIPAPEDKVEYMWFRVVGLAEHKDEELRGELDNDPVLADMTCGDLIEFSRKEIIEVCE